MVQSRLPHWPEFRPWWSASPWWQFGTSAPELAVSAISSVKGDAAISLGNVIGSNLFNLLVILGISAAIVPLSVSSQLVRLDVPLMMLASIAACALAANGVISFTEGAIMMFAFVAYTAFLIYAGRQEASQPPGEVRPPFTRKSLVISLAWLAIGMAGLIFGAQLLVDNASAIARGWGVSDMMIGLTIVAAGTSLPELATSITAAVRGQRDIAVGNVVGSNVFNLLMVLATAADALTCGDHGLAKRLAIRPFGHDIRSGNLLANFHQPVDGVARGSIFDAWPLHGLFCDHHLRCYGNHRC